MIFDRDVLKSVVNELVDLGVEEVEISGGEPFETPELLMFCLKEFLEHGVKIKIFSNLYIKDLFVANIFNRINKLIFEHKDLVEIHFPLNTLNVYTMRKFFRCDGCYPITYSIIDQVVKGYAYTSLIEYLDVVLKNVQMYVKEGVKLGIHFLVTRINYEHFEEVINFAKEIGVNTVSFLRLVKHGRASYPIHWLELHMRKDDWQLFYFKIIKYILKHEGPVVLRFGCPINWFFLFPEFNQIASNKYVKLSYECVGGVKHICITPDLNIYPCVGAKGFNELKLGNLRELSKLRDVFGTKNYENYLRLREELISDECRECVFLKQKLCDSKCLVQKISDKDLLGKPRKRDPLCEILRMGCD